MSLRFRRSIRIAPGVRVNLGKTGASLSLGRRGASIALGRHGVFGNVGIPGTGLSVRESLFAAGTRRPSRGPSSPNGLSVGIALTDDGAVSITDGEGNAVPKGVERRVKQQKGDEIRAWLESQCEHWNRGIDRILGIHLETPPPSGFRPPTVRPFEELPPDPPEPRKLDFLARIFRARRAAIERENASRIERHGRALADWEQRKAAFGASEAQRVQFLVRASAGDPVAMDQVFEQILRSIEWPRETTASFSISSDGKAVSLDVDLPEIEHLPIQEATVAASGFKILVRDRSETRRRRDYLTHVHAVAFRTIGEAFASLPSVEHVTFSGYSQRPNPATGQIEDQYLLSVRVPRLGWEAISFAHLSQIDLPACLEKFELRRRMSKTGVFSPLEPFGAPGDN